MLIRDDGLPVTATSSTVISRGTYTAVRRLSCPRFWVMAISLHANRNHQDAELFAVAVPLLPSFIHHFFHSHHQVSG